MGRRLGNCGAPKESLHELGFKLLVRWSLDIEEGEDAGDVEEQGPSGKGSSRTHSVGCVSHGMIQYCRGDRL